MIKLLAVGVWASAVSVGVTYVTATERLIDRFFAEPVVEAPRYQTIGTAKFSVPVFLDGELRGYMVVKLAATVSKTELGKLTVKLEDYIVDEAFRVLYGRHPGDADAAGSSASLRAVADAITMGVNVRLKVDVVKDVLMSEFLLLPPHGARR
ncbi:MAG: hypothetical protein ACK4MF_01925 [Hyphomicrobiaceae bacterium]